MGYGANYRAYYLVDYYGHQPFVKCDDLESADKLARETRGVVWKRERWDGKFAPCFKDTKIVSYWI